MKLCIKDSAILSMRVDQTEDRAVEENDIDVTNEGFSKTLEELNTGLCKDVSYLKSVVEEPIDNWDSSPRRLQCM